MAKKHEEFLRNLFILEMDVYTGGELVTKLCEEFPNCSRENARKVIEIAVRNKVINSSKPFTFGKNQFAYFSIYHSFTPEMLNVVLKNNRPGIYRVISTLEKNNGVISYLEILKLAAIPLGRETTKKTSLKEITEILEKMNIAKTMSQSGFKYLVSTRKEDPEAKKLMHEHNEKLRWDAIITSIFVSWLKKHHFITTNNVLYRNKITPHKGIIHNQLVWDAVSYTKTTGFTEYIKNNSDEAQTCMLLDAKISGSYSVHDLSGFYDRLQIYRNSVNQNSKRRILPIIVANEIDAEAKKQIRNLNILCFDIATVFGERIFEVFNKLQILSVTNLEQLYNGDLTNIIEESLKSIKESGQETNLGNLKGELFERLMYKVLFTVFTRNSTIKHNFIINYTPNENGTPHNFEYDYLVETDNEYIVFELKGLKSGTFIRKGSFSTEKGKPQYGTIKWFFGWTFPVIKKRFEENPWGKPVKACYITTAKFDEDALKILNEHNNSKLKPDTLDVYYDGQKLIQLLKTFGLKKEIEIIKQYYMQDQGDIVEEIVFNNDEYPF